MATILWLIAAVLVIAGIVQIIQGEIVLGIVLIVVGLLVGPGGVSIFATAPSLAALSPVAVGRVQQSLERSDALSPHAGSAARRS